MLARTTALLLLALLPACRSEAGAQSTSGAAVAPSSAPRPASALPRAENVVDLPAAPTITLVDHELRVDGKPVGSVRAIEETNQFQRIDGELAALRERREEWKKTKPDAPFPGAVLLRLDGDTRAAVIKSACLTAAFAGHPNVGFVVESVAAPGAPARLASLETQADAPMPPGMVDQRKALHVELRAPEKFVLAWKDGATMIASREVPRLGGANAQSFPELGAAATAEWTARGAHREASDRAFDEAVLHVGAAVELRHLVAAIDALKAPKREWITLEGKRERSPTFVVTLAFD